MLPEFFGVRIFREGMKIDYKKEGLVIILECDELLDRPEIISDMDFSRGLYAGYGYLFCHFSIVAILDLYDNREHHRAPLGFAEEKFT